MQTIGLLGGMSWVSTQLYYREINKTIASRLGGAHSAKCLLYSFDFHEIEALQSSGEWSTAGNVLGDAAKALASIGANFIVIGANTMHLVADDVERISGLPVLHIGDATADALVAAGIKRAALLGTRYTMEKPFIRERIERHGIHVLIPDDADRETLHKIIYAELIKDVVRQESREDVLDIIERLNANGAQGIILGCTELELLVTPQYTDVPLFRTAEVHARAAALRAI
ncbi:MAG: aspartate/glutamate racemase family protein [Candidatus Eremiobacteraeota bacterium]|nr:aspartate/glutamate racemase family protein [Candidatus Eremiobacteraeota bacterium]